MAAHAMLDQASAWVCRFAALIAPQGQVLDVACGGGRHARYLAERGLNVEAVDRDAGPLAALAKVAGVRTRCADLESGPWPYEGRQFDAIVVTNYLHRPLFPALLRSLAPGGVLIYETFMVGHERLGRPANPDFLLRPAELLEVIDRELTPVAFEQGQVSWPRNAMMQRLCAVNGAGPVILPE
jgi:SAM-dependent methyltransferase